MVNSNQIYSVLPFWKITYNQDYLKDGYAENIDWPNIISPGIRSLPNFQFNVDKDFTSITSFKLVKIEPTSIITDIDTSLLVLNNTFSNYNIISHYKQTLPFQLECGIYKLQISDGNTTWESEIFEVNVGLDLSNLFDGGSFNQDFENSFNNIVA